MTTQLPLTRPTQRDRVLAQLRDGPTCGTTFLDMHIPRYGGRILELRQDGHNITNEKCWYDPIVVPVSSQQNQVGSCTAFMEMLPMMAEGAKSTCGLSNISNGSPEELRPILNQTYLIMLMRHGLYSAILDGLDKEILDIARGKRKDIEELIGKAMDDPQMEVSGLSKEEQEYVKTVNILVNAQLYSDSWLDI